jgi:molecular chaperone DnaJ
VKGGAGAGYGGFSFHDALEIFMRDFGGFGVEDLFGGGGGRAGADRSRKGPDMRVTLPLTLEEVASGVKRTCASSCWTRAAGAAAAARRRARAGPCSTCGGAARCGACSVRSWASWSA